MSATPSATAAEPQPQSAAHTWFVSNKPPMELSSPMALCDPSDEVQLHYLGDKPEFISTVAKLHFAEWPDVCATIGMPTVEATEEGLKKDLCNKTTLGCTIIATVGGELACCGSLVAEDCPSFHAYHGVKPWLSCVVCVPAFRRRGIAALVYNKISELAQRMGYKAIWLIAETEQLERMYAKAGWKSIETLWTWNPRVFTIMRKDFEPVRPSAVVKPAQTTE